MRTYLENLEIEEVENPISIQNVATHIKQTEELPTKFKIKELNTPIISGLLGSRELFAKALNVKKEEIIPFIVDKVQNPKSYKRVNDAPFLKNMLTLDQNKFVDHYIPLIEFYAGKKYTTSSIVIIKHPTQNRQNASFHRLMYLGDNKFAIRIVPQRDLDNAYMASIEKGEDLNVAIVFGLHPAIEISAAFSNPGLDELELASSFLNGLETYKLPNNIEVPVNSEFVLEGRITNKLAKEGPFIDLTGTADIVREQPILIADKLYHKENPIFRTILPGGVEHRMLMGIPQEPRIFNSILNTIGTVKNVVLTSGGCSWLHAVVQIKKRTEGDPKNTILAALAAHPSLKRVIVVDEDIDASDPNDVEWAIATRVQPDKDLLLVPNAKGSSLDPSAKESITCKWGIDATKPLKNNGKFNKVNF